MRKTSSAPATVAPRSGGRLGARGLLMLSLTRFYSHRPNMMAVLPFISGSSPVSLRMIDWFVTNYTRRHSLMFKADEASPLVNVYLSYRTQLKAYSKQQFDPFRRRDRITYFYDEDTSVETTIGQLNFFRWLVQSKLINYIVEHASDIERDMNSGGGGGGDSAAASLKEEEGPELPIQASKFPAGIRRVTTDLVMSFS